MLLPSKSNFSFTKMLIPGLLDNNDELLLNLEKSIPVILHWCFSRNDVKFSTYTLPSGLATCLYRVVIYSGLISLSMKVIRFTN